MSPFEGLELSYPNAFRDDSVVDDYKGLNSKVPDPYRWLEDSSEAVAEFVEQQVQVANKALEACEERDRVKQKLRELYDFPKCGCPFKAGGKYFYFFNPGLDEFSTLYCQESLEAEPRPVFNPKQLSDDGSLSAPITSVNEDGEYLVIGVSLKGSDVVELRVLHIPENKMLPDVIPKVRFSSPIWTRDNKGFFYANFPDISHGSTCMQLFYHFLGTDVSEDILCYYDPENPTILLEPVLSDDEKYLVMRLVQGANPLNKIVYCDLEALPGGIAGLRDTQTKLPFVTLVDNFDAKYKLIASDGDDFTFYTNKDNASRFKVSRVNIKDPTSWTDVIPEAESESEVLDNVICVDHDKLVVTYLRDVKHALQIHSLQTGALIKEIPLLIGTVSALTGKRDEPDMFYMFESFTTPGIIYRCDLSKEHIEPEVYKESVIQGFDRTLFETKQVHFPSKDGTAQLSLFITGKKGMKQDGNNPVIMYGYGGFGISSPPDFWFSRVIPLQFYNVVYTTAVIRGGGEYGRNWHLAGSGRNKQNCFQDFISCAEYLIKEGYTQASKLAIEGASHGGLLTGACVTQRPDLFGCAVVGVASLDMLRYHKFTIGPVWVSEFGNPDEDGAEWIIKYSPLHNVRRPWEEFGAGVQYPPTIVFAADHDERTVPSHSYKFIATLQYELVNSCSEKLQTNPLVARIERNAGHSLFTKDTQTLINEAGDKFAFIIKSIGATFSG